MLLTTEDSQLLKGLPRFPNEIRVEGRVTSAEALKYLQDVINSKLFP